MTLALKPNPLLGVLLVLAAAALWGTTGTAQSLADGSLSAYWFGALRLAAASLFFAGCVAASRKLASADSTLKRGKLERRDVLGAGLCMAVYNLAFFAGIGTTGVALGTAIALGSGPIWAGLLQAVLHRRRPTAAWWTGTAVAAAGGVLMTLGGDWRTKGFDGVGILLCLLSGLSYAAYTLLNTRMARVAPASTITLQAFGVAAAVALPVAWLVGGAPAFTGADLAAVAYTGVVTAGVPYLLFSQALRHITPATGVTLAGCCGWSAACCGSCGRNCETTADKSFRMPIAKVMPPESGRAWRVEPDMTPLLLTRLPMHLNSLSMNCCPSLAGIRLSSPTTRATHHSSRCGWPFMISVIGQLKWTATCFDG